MTDEPTYEYRYRLIAPFGAEIKRDGEFTKEAFAREAAAGYLDWRSSYADNTGVEIKIDRRPLAATFNWEPVDPEPVKDVHTGHCCSKHGCKYPYKYSDDECTVTSGRAPQEHPCEYCYMTREEVSTWLPEATDDELLAELERRGFSRHVSHRCQNIDKHTSDIERSPGCACHPNIPQPCEHCYAIETLSHSVPWVALALKPQPGAKGTGLLTPDQS